MRDVLDPHPPDHVVVEEPGERGSSTARYPRLGGRRIGERVGATPEPRVDQDPAPAGNAEAHIGATPGGRPTVRPCSALDALSPEP